MVVLLRLAAIALLLFSAGVHAERGERDARYVDAIKRAATSSAKWQRVDERPHLAPAACAAPNTGAARSHVRMSEPDDAPHGKKLYYLHASEPSRYVEAAKRPLPVGFAIVKESFTAVETDEDERLPRDPAAPGTMPAPFRTLVDAGGTRWKIGKRADLFVMVKVGNQVGSDDGWIYGTVAPDGTVTSAGSVGNCMKCHDQATREKLFGLQPEPKW